MTDHRHRVLTALALNRTPGFTFAGNYLGVRFGEQSPQFAQVDMDGGPHCEDDAGQIDYAAVSLLADIAMATAVRANLTPEQRLATVSMQLQFTGAPRVGAMRGIGEFVNFVDGADSRQGLCRVQLSANGQTTAFGTGAFMIMNPPPGQTMFPLVSAVHAGATALTAAELDTHERAILTRADEALRTTGNRRGFVREFWGFRPQQTTDGARCHTNNGPHLGNRVGYLQGGLQLGLAIETAMAALPPDWSLSGISACFLSQGQGEHFVADARIERRGRNTAAVRTVISGENGRRVLVTDSTHLRTGQTRVPSSSPGSS